MVAENIAPKPPAAVPKCECPNPALFEEYIQNVDKAIDTLDEICGRIAQGRASEFDYQLVYSQLKHLDTMFGQMSEMAIRCSHAAKIAKPIVEKHEKVPIITMVNAAPSNYIKFIKERYPAYYDFVACVFDPYMDEARENAEF